MLLSVTQLSSYLYCSRKLFLENVLKLRKIPKEALVKGTIRHETYDMINKNEENVVKSIKKELNFEELFDIYKRMHVNFLRNVIIKNKENLKQVNLPLERAFNESLNQIITESRDRAYNLHKFLADNKVFGEELWSLLTPKIKSELKIESEALKLKGIIDQVEDYSTHLIPYELKTGKAPADGAWPSHKIQIGCYILLLQEKYKEKSNVKEGYVKYLDANKVVPVVMNPFLRNNIEKTRDAIITMIQTLEIPSYCESRAKCQSCEYKEKCYDEFFIKKGLDEIKNKA